MEDAKEDPSLEPGQVYLDPSDVLVEMVKERDSGGGTGAGTLPAPQAKGSKIRREEVIASLDLGDRHLSYCVAKAVAERRSPKDPPGTVPPGHLRMTMKALHVTVEVLAWKTLDIKDPLPGSQGAEDGLKGDDEDVGHTVADSAIDFVVNGYKDAIMREWEALGVQTIIYEEQLGPTRFSPGHPRMWAMQSVIASHLATKWHRRCIVQRGATAGWTTYKLMAPTIEGLEVKDVTKPPGSKSVKDAAKKKASVRVVRHLMETFKPKMQEVYWAFVDARKADDVSDTLIQIASHYRMEMGYGNPRAPAKVKKVTKPRKKKEALVLVRVSDGEEGGHEGEEPEAPKPTRRRRKKGYAPVGKVASSLASIPEEEEVHLGANAKTKAKAKQEDPILAAIARESAVMMKKAAERRVPVMDSRLIPAKDKVVCYCLVSMPGRGSEDGLGRLVPPKPGCSTEGTVGSYIGYTVNLHQRLRRHNNIIKGGAKSTKRCLGDWILACYVEAFPTDTNYSVAMSFEYAWKHAKVSEADKKTKKAIDKGGLQHPRLPVCTKRLDGVLRRDRWTGSCGKEAAEVPLTLHWVWPLAKCPIDPYSLPPHVTLVDHTG